MTSRSRSEVFRWAKFIILPVLVLAMPQGVRAAAAPPASSQAAAVAPAGWLEQAQRNLAEREYEVSWQAKPVVDDLPSSWHAPNRAHGFRTYFTADGIHVVPRTESTPSWRWGLSLVGYGNAETTWSVPRANLAAAGHRISYHRGALEEFYVNTPEGLEQGFILPAPPGEAGAGGVLPELKGWTTPRGGTTEGSLARLNLRDSSDVVHLDLALWGDLSPRISEDGQAIDFVTPAGAPVLHYAQLKVTDARESVLPSWMEGFASEGVRGIRIVVDARQAVYPVTIDPLSTGWAWTGVGGQANVYYGAPVATAGDVNGDGYSDVIVGASFYDNGQTDEGRAVLYLGSASGPGTIANWTAESNQGNAHFGYPVATAGDVNGDGYADVLVGANGYSNTLSGAGRAYLYLGSASGLATTPAWTADGDQEGAGFGIWAATAGDVNGDGYSDVVVGAWLYDNSELDAGRAYLYLGSASGLATTPAWTADGDQPGAEFGFPITTAGDVNGDGYADVIAGASLYDNGQPDEGRAYLYLGSASGLATTPVWTVESNQASAQFGNSVSTAGDVNGDGFADLAVGARYYDNGQSNEGRAFVYLGSAVGPGTIATWTAECDQANAHFGFTVATAGDVNGDGYADVIVGAELYSFGQASEGRAFVYLGSAAGLATAPVWTAESDQAGAQFGQVVAAAGDVNGDGYSDVIVGAPNYDNVHFDEGRAYLYLGSAYGPSMTAAWTAQSDQAASSFAYSVATAGDVNGDGYADVIVGDPDYGPSGRAYLFLGSASGLAVTPAWVVDGFEFVGSFGISVAAAGDVNGDGYSDVIVGDYSQNGPGAQNTSQSARIFLGSATGLSTAPAWILSGPHTEARFGASVRTAGDVNGDGYDDILVGAIWYSNGQSQEGAIFLYLGSATGPSGSAWSVESNVAGRQFGTSMGTAGDVNGDGYDDVIVGDYLDSNGQTNEGRAYLYLGSVTGLSPTPVWTAESNQAEARFGASVGTAGDVNGDGYADVIVGAPYYSAGQTNEGRAYVYLGSASGLALNPVWLADGQQHFPRLGASRATVAVSDAARLVRSCNCSPCFTNVSNSLAPSWFACENAPSPASQI